jgi:hypothetical protein
MRIISTILTLCVVVLVAVRCSDQEVQKPIKNQVELKFKVNGVKETVIAQIVYNKALGRKQLVSDELIEIEAKHHKTKLPVYVYALKSQIRYDKNGRRLNQDWPDDTPGGSEGSGGTLKRGYYGYVDGCFIYGTLVSFASGEEYFYPSTGINAVANPPICPGGEWT